MMKSLLTLPLLLISLSIFSQITLTRENSYPQAGQSYSYYFLEAPALEASEGMNQSWDLSLTSEDIRTLSFTNPQDFPSAEVTDDLFPDATLVMDAFFFNFIDANEESISALGYYDESSNSIHSDPLDLIRFPMSYGDSYEDQGIENSTFDQEDLNAYIVTNQYSEIDAQGTLILPYTTIDNVIRLKQEVSVNQSTGGDIFDFSYISYEWYDGVTNTFLARYFEPLDAVGSGSYMILDEDSYITSSVNSLSQIDLELYPNPSESFIQISGLTQTTSYEISSLTGSIALRGQIKKGQSINIQDLAPGIYSVQLENNLGVTRKQLIKS